MDISSGGLPSIDNSQGSQVYSAALAKSHQKLEGEAALALIQSAASSSQIVSNQPSASSVTATLGQNINIRV
ncbi:hypothetical protein KO527_05620 [Pseudoalteromonas sp. C2R02]|uniref:hypothetical protein n=1 Tax=Pseudoalteromonas sp. C2R02 TaxID=2841565 RepID=UPI001C098B15|nr:hypothetical protein [Pseudoalteromonas sp. C2R02]MBU2968828.1 hypothetical protein [Pseudoalteromonas sp. C2R02]